MKKITLLFAMMFIGITLHAQELSVESNAPFTPNSGENLLEVIWDQPISGTSGIISDYSNNVSNAVYSADDFELTESTKLTTITVNGFQNDGNLPDIINGFQLFIYNNLETANIPDGDPTIPGSGVLELSDISTLPIPGFPIVITAGEQGAYTFTVDMTIANADEDVVLPAGIYWLVVAPRLNLDDITVGAPRWNWYNSDPDLGVNEAHLIDPDDLFGGGFTSWSSFSSLGLDFFSTSFTIEGEPALSTQDNISDLVSVFPNPINNILNVRMPSNIDLISSNLYDLLGRDTGLRLVDGTMNTSSLAKGVYILNVNTSAGTLTQKVIKQ